MPLTEQDLLSSGSIPDTDKSPIIPSFPSYSERTGKGERQRFSMETRTVVMVGTILSSSWLNKGFYSAIISVLLLLFLIADRKKKTAKTLFIYYLVIFLLYSSMMHWGFRFVMISPVQVYIWWKSFPVLIAAAALVTSPPGMIGAFLSKLHCPKKLIVGVLVIFRFFPTTSAAVKRLNDALKNRGLMSIKRVLLNPLDSLEYLLVPIMMALINSTDRLSSSAVTRGAEAPTKRTSYYYQPQSTNDYICWIICALITGVVAFYHFTGATS